MQRSRLGNQLDHGLKAMQQPLPAPTRTRLLDYLELLERWNRSFNLTAVRDQADMVTRHLLDALSIAPYVTGGSLLDIGSGAGLPGLVLAICNPGHPVRLLDSNGKKARFLREAVRQLGLQHVSVEQQRVEQATGQYDCITARAFASLPDMLRWGGHLLAREGRWLAMKGRYPEEELDALPAEFEAEHVHALKVPGLDAQRHLVVLRHAAPAPG